ncbi:MAG: retention module-containing protein, partial [Thiobacillus sp.]|uniref:retention module-containing protein n=1 Tax=Thiobacillus sp. TaxID=924 RepID=UPI00273272B7
MRPLRAGDVLREGDSVVTMPGGQVQLAFLDGKLLTLLPDETFQFSAETASTSRPDVAEASLPAGEAERIIQALERGEDIDAQLEDTAAGLNGGADNAGNDFVRLLRIAEGVGPLAFQFEARGTTEPEFIGANTNAVVTNPAAPVPILVPVPTITHVGDASGTVSNVTVPEGTAAVFTVNLSNAASTPTSFALA